MLTLCSSHARLPTTSINCLPLSLQQRKTKKSVKCSGRNKLRAALSPSQRPPDVPPHQTFIPSGQDNLHFAPVSGWSLGKIESRQVPRSRYCSNPRRCESLLSLPFCRYNGRRSRIRHRTLGDFYDLGRIMGWNAVLEPMSGWESKEVAFGTDAEKGL